MAREVVSGGRRQPGRPKQRGGRPRGWAGAGLAAVALLASVAGIALGGSLPATAASRDVAPSVVAATIRVAQTPDGDVSYRSVGRGTPLVLIMGYEGSMDAWQPSFVDALARRYHVITFDNAGIGRTTALPSPLTVSAMAQQTAAFITTLGLHRPDVLGWSMGGMIAQALAVLSPADVGRLVLAATFPGDGHDSLPAASAQSALTSGSLTAISAVLFPAGQQVAAAAYLHGIVAYPHFYVADATVVAAQGNALGTWFSGAEPAGHWISHLQVPTLVMDGNVDALDPATNDRHLAATIPHAQLTLYPDAGHGFLFQDQSAVVARVERFLGAS